MYIHRTSLVDTEGVQQGDTVSCDMEYDNRKGKCNTVNCTVTSSGGGGNHDDGGDDVFMRCEQLADTEGLRQGNTCLTTRNMMTATKSAIHNDSFRRTVVGGGGGRTSSNHKRNSVIIEMWSPKENFCIISQCSTEKNVVRKCIYEFVSVFCGKEEDEEQTMEEWVVKVRDTMHMFVAESDCQGLVGDG